MKPYGLKRMHRCICCVGRELGSRAREKRAAEKEIVAEIKILDLKLWDGPGWDRVKQTAERLDAEDLAKDA